MTTFNQLNLSALLFFLIVGGSIKCYSQDETPTKFDPEEYVSGTLPVLYVTTENEEEITSKDYYLTATYWLDAMGIEGYENVGSAAKPLATQIKGRGNATWRLDKKPYRLKLDKKAELLGMKKNKHFVLLANANDVNFRKDAIGFELSRRMGLEWTPTMKPIELVINGDYRGVYYLCEKIRVEPDRVNIVEQADEETAPETITGGWLVEIDNYVESNQVTIPDRTNGGTIKFTPETPEVLSAEQKEYLTNLVTKVDNAIYDNDPNGTEWSEYIDIDALARFYVIQEIMDNGECFSGSCYWHKDIGEDTKIVFGPVWDFGCSYCHSAQDFQRFIYEDVPSYSSQRWIGEIAKHNNFQAKVREIWAEFKANAYDGLFDYIDAQGALIIDAMNKDHLRWPQYATYSIPSRIRGAKMFLTKKIAWLDEMWDEPIVTALKDIELAQEDIINTAYYDINGRSSAEPYSGFNIIVVNYKNGSKKVSKAVLN